MAWVVEYQRANGFVRVTAQGEADRAALRELTREAMATGHANGCSRFLIDHRRTTLALGTAEIFDMPRRGEDGGFGPDLRIAILIDPASPSRPDFEFYAIQCGNLGIHFLRLFLDEESAVDWLAPKASNE
ncbi:hypothetical protein [Arenimonas composti]|uniref:STAS/SEC14 domain-containing protein n=1 Tax=Arenimonas composti TR7-09 = DSM 18010 TaxID=1121013 RepID=A0A091BCW8_9GAMM|nr:hypothetical protein [Arenimonas composti]KFN49581.1 hypothetical protein P873_10530 [Arenimonas composti TR7-09 = DSM 18010]